MKNDYAASQPTFALKNPCQKIMSGQIIVGLKEFCQAIQTKLETPIQYWDCWKNKTKKNNSETSSLVPVSIEQWKKLGFTSEEAWLWINAGAELDDYAFVAWLRDIKKKIPEWISNYQEDYQILSYRFKKYGLCQECNNPNTGEQWCQECNSKHFEKDFAKWTSNNVQIDQFIQKYQLEATGADKLLEWIPYEQFTDIEYLAEGGFGKVYKAKWAEGNIHHWDAKKKQWQKEKDNYRNCKMVALKSLNDSQANTEFLQEIEKHKIIDDWFNNIVPCYGISREPQTGDYLMVMKYMPEGNLRKYLSNNRELSLKDKLSQLLHIAQGLKDIHQKNLVHCDFHPGNILKGIEKTSCLITDLGLCKPAGEASQEDKIFGVLPYVAPEVLTSEPYTQKSDIYSFGIVAYELLSGLPPYYDIAHDLNLAIGICRGSRPQFQIKIPQLLEDLIKRCWDANPAKRPTANELERTLRGWEQGNNEFKDQLQAAEEFNQTLSDKVKCPDYKKQIHTEAVYYSKLLPTKEVTSLLQSLQLSKISQSGSDSKQVDLEIPADLNQLDLSESSQEQISLQAQIQQNYPSKNN